MSSQDKHNDLPTNLFYLLGRHLFHWPARAVARFCAQLPYHAICPPGATRRALGFSYGTVEHGVQYRENKLLRSTPCDHYAKGEHWVILASHEGTPVAAPQTVHAGASCDRKGRQGTTKPHFLLGVKVSSELSPAGHPVPCRLACYSRTGV